MSGIETEQFDPYRKWLGIPPAEQPPDHYRLLGIAAFEDDPDVIENAADRQMAHVRRYQTGKRGAESQRLLNELASAKVCLLDPEKKQQYDNGLNAAASGSGIATHEPPPPVPPPPIVDESGASGPISPEALLGEPLGADLEAAVGSRDESSSDAPAPAPPQPKTKKRAAPAPIVASSPSRSTGSRGAMASRGRRKQSVTPVVAIAIAGGVLMVVVIAVVVGMSSSGKNKKDKNTADSRKDGSTKKEKDIDKSPLMGKKNRDRFRPPSRRPGRDIPGLPPISSEVDPITPLPDLTDDPLGRAARVKNELRLAREALLAGDVETARTHLGAADVAKSTKRESHYVEHVRTLMSFLDQFKAAGVRGWTSYRPDSKTGEQKKITFRGKTGYVTSVAGSEMTYQVGDEEFTINAADLTRDEKVEFAREGTREDDPFVNVYAAAFTLFNKEGEEAERRQAAKKLYELAKAEGIHNQALERELYGAGDPDNGDDGGSGYETDDELFGELPDLPGGQPRDDPSDPNDTRNDEPVATDDRLPVPDDAGLRDARARMTKIYRDEIRRAVTQEQKNALAQSIIRQASAESDAALKFAMLDKARDIAIDLANPDAVVLVIDEMGDKYRIDTLTDKAQSLSRCAANIKTNDDAATIFEHAQELYKQSVEGGRYRTAASFARVASRVAGRANRPEAIRSVEQELRRIDTMVVEMDRADDARETLAANPDDRDANLQLGRFLCFYKEDWKRGLPHLAKSNDEELSDLANRELAHDKSVEDQVRLGDDWLKYGRRIGGPAGDGATRWAQRRFEHVVNKIEGSEKGRVQAQLQEIDDLLAEALPSLGG
jgi:hypothetical protein